MVEALQLLQAKIHLKMVSMNISSSSTGEIKTIKPVVLEGDFSAGHPDGLTASSAVISYGLSIPATGSGTSFSGTLDISELDNLSVSEVAKELAEELRTPSPSIEISGNSLAKFQKMDQVLESIMMG